MSAKKVLIITYYWPPAGGPGVQRWLKFAKYLPEMGWEPIIYTPENPSYPIIDETLSKEVSQDLKIVKTKIWEPYQIAEKLNPKAKDYKAGHFENANKQSFLSKISVFIRGNFFIPDARKFWIKPSTKFLRKYLAENQIETVITTGPPHSLHLIGKNLKSSNPKLKWIADFRDPWTQISYHKELKLTSYAAKKHENLEKSVFTQADLILATSFTDAENYKKLGANRVEVITNGFEENQFDGKKIFDSKFKITYSGGLEIARNPKVVWEALSEICVENELFKNDFKLIFWGNLSHEVEVSIKSYGLENKLEIKGYVSHQESIRGIKNADLLLLTNFSNEESKGIIPGKLFEYLATGNPILAIGPEKGDVKRILQETKSGEYFTHEDKTAIKDFILRAYQNWKNGFASPSNADVLQYSRKSLTQKLVKVLEDLN